MPRLDDSRDDLIRALEAHYGPAQVRDSTGPADTRPPFDRLAAIALGLMATPKVAAAAHDALRDAGMLQPETLAAANPLEIDDILKHARVAMAIKSLRPLQKLARWAADGGLPADAAEVADRPTAAIRDEWRAINGIGPATADALLLLGLGRASYPVDRATYRILVRHGWLDPIAEHDEAREVIERLAWDGPPGNDPAGEAVVASLLADLGRWFERLGRDFCKPARAACERCPLRPWLPPNGPVEVE